MIPYHGDGKWGNEIWLGRDDRFGERIGAHNISMTHFQAIHLITTSPIDAIHLPL